MIFIVAFRALDKFHLFWLRLAAIVSPHSYLRWHNKTYRTKRDVLRHTIIIDQVLEEELKRQLYQPGVIPRRGN